jgi:hypothetical protein
MAVSEDDKLVVVFKTHTQKNEAKSKAAGRPIYDEVEVCEIKTPGDKLSVGVFPAHSFHRWITDDSGDQVKQTYAMRWNAQYRRFKEGRTQVQEGTPLDELPFLTASKRMDLKALSIYTAETLAALDGQNLKTLGPGGRELKDQAQAYIDKASGSADTVRMAGEIAALKERIASMESEQRQPAAYPDMDDEALKEAIKEATGAKPRGNPSRATLERMLAESSKQTEAAA